MNELLAYHYTSKEAFLNIINNMLQAKDSNTCFEFWASSCFCLNDYIELKHGYKVLMELLKEEERDRDERYRLSNIHNEIKMEGMTDEKVYNFILDNSFIMERIPYVISFSFMPEQIPLWSMYGGKGKGVCLCFDLNEILEFSRQEMQGLSFVPIVYNIDTIQSEYKKMIKDTIIIELDNYYNNVKEITDSEQIWYKKLSVIRVMCTVLSPYFKHLSFEFENEYRLVKYCGPTENVECRVNSNGYIIPYVKIKVPFNSLKKITIGPCADYKLDSSIIHSYMKYCDPKHYVPIEPSLVPLRNI